MTYKVTEVTEQEWFDAQLGEKRFGGVIVDGITDSRQASGSDEVFLLVTRHEPETITGTELVAAVPRDWVIAFAQIHNRHAVIACHPQERPRYAYLADLPQSFEKWTVML